MSNKRYGPYVAIVICLALFAGVLASDRAVTTNIKDAYPIAHWLEGGFSVGQHWACIRP